MPIKLQEDFPAKEVLDHENIFAIDNNRALQQDIRPLKLIILNLMPNKIDTETQLLRLISNTPLQIDIDFLQVSTHISKNTDKSHLAKFYTTFEAVKTQKYDGLIITGAPLEHLGFEQVDYWDELCKIMDWSQSNVFSTLHICWGAQAGLFHHYNIDKRVFEEKIFGVYPQHICSEHFLLTGFDDVFYTPQSRYTGVKEEQIEQNINLEILSKSTISGINMLSTKNAKNIFILGHLEYDTDTLKQEYERDLQKGLDTKLPYGYFPRDDAKEEPENTWRAHANLFYHNWLNLVYQQTPYNIEDI